MNTHVSLSGLDAAFPSLETLSTPMHMLGTFVLDASGASGGYSVDFGIIACERSVPDVADIALGFGAAVIDLRKLALEQMWKAPSMWRKRATPDAAPLSVASN